MSIMSTRTIVFSIRAVEVIRPRAVRRAAGISSCCGKETGAAYARPRLVLSLGSDGIAAVVFDHRGILARLWLLRRKPCGFRRPQ